MLANPRRRRRRTATRRRSVTVRVNRRRRRAGVRRNPSIGGALNMITRGVKDAAFMVGGEMASNVVASYIPAFLTTTDAAGVKTETDTGKAARKVIAAAVVGYLAQMAFRGGDAARLAVAGALAAPLKSFIRPILPTQGKFTAANLLSAYPTGLRLASYPGTQFASYPGTQMTMLPAAASPRAGMALSGYGRRGVGCDDGGSQLMYQGG